MKRSAAATASRLLAAVTMTANSRPEAVHHDVSLAARVLLAGIVAGRAARPSGLDRRAVHIGRAGRAVAAGLLPDPGAQGGDLLNLTAAQVGLGTLGFYNGGLTQTLPLLAGSLALDHGDDSVLSFLTTDQNGKPRKFGSHVDIGAFEIQVPPVNLVGRRNGPLF